jgi:stage II sporulation protein M
VAGQLHLWSFLAAVVLCGLIFGGIAAGQLNSSDTLALSNATLQLLQAIAAHQLAPANALWWQRMVADGQFLALLWLLGVSIIGMPFIVIAMFLRGFSIGFAVGFTVIQFGWRGFLLASIGIFLHQLLSLTALVFAAAIAIRFSGLVLRQSLPTAALAGALANYTGWFLLCACLLMGGAAVQAWLSPHLLGALLSGS